MAKNIRIAKTLIRCNAENLPDNVIASTVYINDTFFVQHAGIFIRYNGISYLFHYTGKAVKLENFEKVHNADSYFFKELKFIKHKIIGALLYQCKKVEQNARPEYGYFHTSLAQYNSNGIFENPGEHPEYMTCVGFCLNFLNYFLSDEDYFYYADWDIDSIQREKGFVENFIDEVRIIYPQINIEDFEVGLRRIFPIEYIAGAYSDNLPVRKEFTNAISPKIQKELTKRRTA